MEEYLAKLNNKLSRKRTENIEVVGTCNDNGELRQVLSEPLVFNEDYDYMVSLTSFEGTSYFPNIIRNKNNVFYYSKPGETIIRKINFPDCEMEVEEISNFIQSELGNNDIKISVLPGVGKSKIELKRGYKVYLKDDSFKDILGYKNNTVLDKEENESPEICDVVKTNKIYIYLDIIQGRIYNEYRSNIFYSFLNKDRFGYPIYKEPKNPKEYLLTKKKINSFTFKFTDERNKPITFLKTPISLTFEIKQV